LLETTCEAIALSAQSPSHWLAEKLRSGWPPGNAWRKIAEKMLVFGFLIFPMMTLVPCILALALLGLHRLWLVVVD
jgi:hypothetical protein